MAGHPRGSLPKVSGHPAWRAAAAAALRQIKARQDDRTPAIHRAAARRVVLVSREGFPQRLQQTGFAHKSQQSWPGSVMAVALVGADAEIAPLNDRHDFGRGSRRV
jgi:hypothetical protein